MTSLQFNKLTQVINDTLIPGGIVVLITYIDISEHVIFVKQDSQFGITLFSAFCKKRNQYQLHIQYFFFSDAHGFTSVFLSASALYFIRSRTYSGILRFPASQSTTVRYGIRKKRILSCSRPYNR